MDQRPIGVFDSGVGGLSVVRDCAVCSPARTSSTSAMWAGFPTAPQPGGHLPLCVRGPALPPGPECEAHHRRLRHCQLGDRFLPHRPGCPCPIPASSNPPPGRQPLPPAIKRWASSAPTPPSAAAPLYGHSMPSTPPPKRWVRAVPCWCRWWKNGYIDFENKVTRLVLEDYLRPIRESGADTLILGCTHFPLLAPIIGDMLGEGVTLIDSGAATARLYPGTAPADRPGESPYRRRRAAVLHLGAHRDLCPYR